MMTNEDLLREGECSQPNCIEAIGHSESHSLERHTMMPEQALAKLIKNLEAFRPLQVGLYQDFTPDLNHLIDRLQPGGDLHDALLRDKAKPKVLAEGWAMPEKDYYSHPLRIGGRRIRSITHREIHIRTDPYEKPRSGRRVLIVAADEPAPKPSGITENCPTCGALCKLWGDYLVPIEREPEQKVLAEGDVWLAPRPFDLEHVLEIMCAHVGFPQCETQYGATECLHVTITRRVVAAPKREEE